MILGYSGGVKMSWSAGEEQRLENGAASEVGEFERC